MNKVFKFILDLFFPNRCPVCRSFIGYNELFCGKCISNLKKYRADNLHQETGRVFTGKVLAGFYYENEAKDGILSLKDGCKAFGCYLGDILAGIIKDDKTASAADCIVPVPMSEKSFRERGYNQAEVIAKEISRKTGITVRTDILHKNESEVQHSLNKEQRMKNVSAYNINKIDISGMKIIVCDDVMTTGSTANRCAELLKSMGAAEVYAAVGTTTKLKKE